MQTAQGRSFRDPGAVRMRAIVDADGALVAKVVAKDGVNRDSLKRLLHGCWKAQNSLALMRLQHASDQQSKMHKTGIDVIRENVIKPNQNDMKN